MIGPQVMSNIWIIGKILMCSHAEIVFRLDAVKIYDFISYGFPDPVECQNVVPLAQSGMRKCSTCDNRSIVTCATLPHSTLSKRYNILAFHRVRDFKLSPCYDEQFLMCVGFQVGISISAPHSSRLLNSPRNMTSLKCLKDSTPE